MLKGNLKETKRQGSTGASAILCERVYLFAQPLLRQLSKELDRRLVQTFFDLLLVILIHRHRNHGLVLSELGGVLMGMERAPAGNKRISHLLHAKGWKGEEIEEWMWQQGDQRVAEGRQAQEEVYVIWDESEIEKVESMKPERLCPVRSAKARRLKRIKKGYYNPPGGRPVFVPGFHWFQIVVTGLKGAICLAHYHWWTSRGKEASDLRTEEGEVLQKLAKQWGKAVIHVWDRGFAGAPWLLKAITANVRFIVRWKKGNYLIDQDGQRCKASDISRRKRSVDHRMIYDNKRRCERKTGIVFFPVHLPDDLHTQLWMVVSRPGPGRQPWFILTNEPVLTAQTAWRIVFAYNRRWTIETSIRFDKSELAIESIRIVDWAARKKLMLLVAFVHALLLYFLAPALDYLRSWLLDIWCHRTGKRSRLSAAPLYRLRLALSSLWIAFRPLALPRLI